MKKSDKVDEVESFKYLGSILKKNCSFEKDINYTIKYGADFLGRS